MCDHSSYKADSIEPAQQLLQIQTGKQDFSLNGLQENFQGCRYWSLFCDAESKINTQEWTAKHSFQASLSLFHDPQYLQLNDI